MRPCINFAAARSGVFCIYGGGVLASTPAMRCSKHTRIRLSELVAAFGTLYAVCLSAALQLYETATIFLLQRKFCSESYKLMMSNTFSQFLLTLVFSVCFSKFISFVISCVRMVDIAVSAAATTFDAGGGGDVRANH